MRKHTYDKHPSPGFDRLVAAAYLGMCVRRLDYMMSDGTGPSHFRIGFGVRYWPAELDRYLQAHPEQRQLASRTRSASARSFDPHLELVPEVGDILSVPQLARCLGVCPRILAYWHASGTGPVREKIDGRVQYRGSEVRRYLCFEQQLAMEDARHD